jgi:hypothetical protein
MIGTDQQRSLGIFTRDDCDKFHSFVLKFPISLDIRNINNQQSVSLSLSLRFELMWSGVRKKSAFHKRWCAVKWKRVSRERERESLSAQKRQSFDIHTDRFCTLKRIFFSHTIFPLFLTVIALREPLAGHFHLKFNLSSFLLTYSCCIPW